MTGRGKRYLEGGGAPTGRRRGDPAHASVSLARFDRARTVPREVTRLGRSLSVALPGALALGLSFWASPATATHGAHDHSQNMKHLAHVPRLSAATESDLAFVGKRTSLPPTPQ